MPIVNNAPPDDPTRSLFTASGRNSSGAFRKIADQIGPTCPTSHSEASMTLCLRRVLSGTNGANTAAAAACRRTITLLSFARLASAYRYRALSLA